MSGNRSRVLLVRHGQSDWNEQGLIQGQQDPIALSDLGRRQASAAAEHLRGCHVDLLISSDLLRATETAAPIAAVVGLPVTVDRRWREQSYGHFEGQRSVDVARADIDWTDPNVRVGGGESIHDVYTRVGAALQETLAVVEGTLLAVSHGDTIRAATAWLCGRPSSQVPFEVPPNGAVRLFELERGRVVDVQTSVPSLAGQAG